MMYVEILGFDFEDFMDIANTATKTAEFEEEKKIVIDILEDYYTREEN